MADPHDVDIHVEDASPSSGEVPDPPDSKGGIAKQGGNENSGEGGDPGGDDHLGYSHFRGNGGSGASAADGEGLTPHDERVPVVDEGGPRCVGLEEEPGRAFPRSNPVPKARKELQFVEAKPDGKWFKAIEARDCLSLMEILDAKEDDASRVPLCYETGEEGRTALHVAAMQGCFRLAKQLIDLIIERNPSNDGDLSRVANIFMNRKDGRSGLTALEMDDIIGNTSISQFIKCVEMGQQRYERVQGGMYEAYEGTEWCTALEQGNCDMLQTLFRCNSRFLLQTCDGFSVLDVAIMKGDAKLVEMVVRAFGPAQDPKISWPTESYFPSELKWQQIAERHSAWDLKNSFQDGVSRGNLAKLVGSARAKTKQNLYSVKSALDLADKLESSEIKKTLGMVGELHGQRTVAQNTRQGLLGPVPAAGVFDTRIAFPEQLSEWQLPEFQVLYRLAAIIQEYWNREWTAGFLADVDYSFEDKRSLRFPVLRFLYACKHPLLCQRFIEMTLHDCEALITCLCVICDGRGRTPGHTLVDHYDPHCAFDKISYYTDEATFYGRDSRGRSCTMRAITKQFLEKETMVSCRLVQYFENNSKEMEKMHFTKEKYIPRHDIRHAIMHSDQLLTKFSLDTWLFIVALIFQDEHVLRLMIRESEGSVLETLLDGVDLESSDGERVETRTILVAAASGSQAILRLCLKKFDPMVEDGERRTTLHYAADANMFKFLPPPRSFYCSIDSYHKAEEQWMKKHKAEIQSKVNANARQNLNPNPQPTANSIAQCLDSNMNPQLVGRRACILMLLQAGVDLSQEDKGENIPNPGSSSDASFQSWWYETLVKDTVDKKNSFNEAGNALSVVGALVAATSYIGPLQPPMSYSDGYVQTSKMLIKVFMVSNTLAFYLAVASVMFAVVPSLPMPQEGVVDELKRARQIVSSSLFLLLASIGCILVSFAAASAVVVDNEHYYGGSDFLLTPSIIGWFFCLIAMASFFIRVVRLVIYRNSMIRKIYKFSFSGLCKKGARAISIFCLSVLWWVLVVILTPLSMCRTQSIKDTMKMVQKDWLEEYSEIKANYSSPLFRSIENKVSFNSSKLREKFSLINRA